MYKLEINTTLLYHYLEKRELSKRKLAQKADLSEGTISAIFKRKEVTITTINKIIAALNIPDQDAGKIFFAKELHSA